ncbi:hypothetical protein [Sediminispirochaeta bajacaliforniensis]|uniref:hypothetical protein n=1 Tax=Sediminispirochaeta bajacaliforniensis TaxID=148 RepID=UPI00035EBC63|nr:hypothetical protein [Sediminispirochaeta bajacaliforniensis]
MKEKLRKFLRILSVEISAMEEGIVVLLDSTSERHDRREITEYVWTENSALLRHELQILKAIHEEVDRLSAESFSSVDEAGDAVLSILTERSDAPRALYSFFQRRMVKIYRYIDEE